MPLNEILKRLSGVTKNGNGFMALCPAHGDRNMSLSVKHCNGATLLHCFAGCTIKSVVAAMDLTMSDLFDDAPKVARTSAKSSAPSDKVRKHIAATFDYRDSDNRLCYQVVRFDPKGFGVRRPTDDRKWEWSLGGIKPILYRLSELKDMADPIVIAEGEKQVDALVELGISATTNPFGALKWQSEYNEHFHGRDVILWPDNDSTGRRHMELVARSLDGLAKSILTIEAPDSLPEKGDVCDGITNLGWNRGDIDRILAKAKPWEPAEDSDSGEQDGGDDVDEKKEAPESQALRLAKIVADNATLFHDQHRNPYAQVRIADHREVLRCGTSDFRRWMSYKIYTTEKKATGKETINAAVNLLEAIALHDGDQIELFNRVAIHDDAYWLDLSDKRCRAVRITAEGWEIVDNPPILFTRHSHQASQVEPKSGGNLDGIFDFIPIKDTNNRLLLKTWLVSCLIPNIPHPIPVLHGPQGSGKTSTARLLRRLIDPSSLETLSFPRNQAELAQILSHHYLVPFDNIDALQAWQSDALCRGCTGEGISKRQLYTDDDDVIYSFRRCIILNGINIAATKADLLDRSILIGLERIPNNERRDEEGLESAFTQARPQILGGMLDALVKSIELKPSVELTAKPRMADFARWGCAIAQALGRSSEDFAHAYEGNVVEQNAEVLDGHPVAAAVMALMDKQDRWEGRPADLLRGLLVLADAESIDVNARNWPKAANVLTRRLKEVKTNLQDAGIHINHLHSGNNTIAIRKEPKNTVQTVHTVHHQKNQQDSDGRFADDTDDTTAPREKTVHDTVQSQPVDMAEDMFPLEGLDGLDGKFQKPSVPADRRIEI